LQTWERKMWMVWISTAIAWVRMEHMGHNKVIVEKLLVPDDTHSEIVQLCRKLQQFAKVSCLGTYTEESKIPR
jgi:helix-turn-helix protein